jgi:beta-glucanase (GH16 family)
MTANGDMKTAPAGLRWALLALLGLLTSCGGGGGQSVANPPPPPPPPPSPSPGNVNIDNPTLTVADNFRVSPGGALTLVWSDEFDGSRLDPKMWYFESGDGSQYGIPGWGNNELQWYLPDSAGVSNGTLRITARRESRNGKDYTSARINTRDRFAFRYGRIEARMKLPRGQGLWPAFWLLPQDQAYGSWAASGEIDIVEARNPGSSGGNTIYGVLHYGGQWPRNVSSGEAYAVATDVTADFHTYVLEWDEAEIRWYVNGILFAVRNTWFTSASPFPAPFDQRFYILLNLAVGGSFPGSPTASTIFPVTMEVDYVRVYSGRP